MTCQFFLPRRSITMLPCSSSELVTRWVSALSAGTFLPLIATAPLLRCRRASPLAQTKARLDVEPTFIAKRAVGGVDELAVIDKLQLNPPPITFAIAFATHTRAGPTPRKLVDALRCLSVGWLAILFKWNAT